MGRASIPYLVIATFMAAAVSGCGNDKDARPMSSTGETPGAETILPGFDINRIANGAKLYQENCAQCHGPEAQGHPDWERGRKEGFAAAPPLNGTGTDSNLSRARMMEIIRNGVTRDNVPLMPAWQGRVADKDVEDIIAWYQALWPGEVYNKWRRANAGDAPAPGSKS